MVLKDITISFENSKYVVKYSRTHYYFGIFKGQTYVAKEESFDSLESAKYSILQELSDNKVLISKELNESLLYSEVVRKQYKKGN